MVDHVPLAILFRDHPYSGALEVSQGWDRARADDAANSTLLLQLSSDNVRVQMGRWKIRCCALAPRAHVAEENPFVNGLKQPGNPGLVGVVS